MPATGLVRSSHYRRMKAAPPRRQPVTVSTAAQPPPQLTTLLTDLRTLLTNAAFDALGCSAKTANGQASGEIAALARQRRARGGKRHWPHRRRRRARGRSRRSGRWGKVGRAFGHLCIAVAQPPRRRAACDLSAFRRGSGQPPSGSPARSPRARHFWALPGVSRSAPPRSPWPGAAVRGHPMVQKKDVDWSPHL